MLTQAARPEDLGISSKKILAFCQALPRAGLTPHALVILRHGQVAFQMAWQPYGLETPHILNSLTKTFTSVGVGLAVGEGRCAYSDPIADLLGKKVPQKHDPLLKTVTLGDLMSMSSGLDPASDSMPTDGTDWATHTLSYPIIKKPGTYFDYNSMGSYLCSAVVTEVTGQSLREYLTPRLFEPLGIASPTWLTDSKGINTGGFGLYVSALDVAKLGELLLRDGVWQGRRLLPEGWVALASSKIVDTVHHKDFPEWRQGYGYHIWRCRDGHFRADGRHGQLCWVMPDLDAVAVLLAGNVELELEATLLHDQLIPAIDSAESTPADEEALRAFAQSASYAPPAYDREAPALNGAYQDAKGKKLSFRQEGEALLVTLPANGCFGACTVRLGKGEYLPGKVLELQFNQWNEMDCLGAYGWQGRMLETVIRLPGAAIWRRDRFTFDDYGLAAMVEGVGLTTACTYYTRA